MAKKKQTESFENSLKRLEEISELLENDEIGLDESIKLYEEGILLSKICYSKLKDAELKITELKSHFESNLGDE
ncbi:MAG: exodeoxyribonuclease VII small subunit [Melioribacteraceae bacterium]|jgi:exodeoxyribonuclease VII small subunit|nr:exodeoxyribonuclease VII small subunit [Melioribacteraceae bacterium]RJP61525.1 MAG: exodeoxyribonuclease VII small subunit [Ignavibacteriales bacterium]WKZ70592.1 MAG: exodeoxyribonuclease VII small subunit [Melioribacteraceae bacterium]